MRQILFVSIMVSFSLYDDLNLFEMSPNVSSVSEVPRRGIWAECRRHEARYALLAEVAKQCSDSRAP